MKPVDYAKAVGLGFAVLAVNMLSLGVIVFAWSQAFARGRPQAFYNELAMDTGRWSAPIVGAVLMFLVGYLFGRRRPERNAVAFALAVFAAYVLIDTASGFAMSTPAEFLNLQFLASLAVTGLGALAGGGTASRPHAVTP